MDYLNINLNNDHERNTNILDGYDLETLFLEISCNVTEINEETVTQQFYESLNSKIQCAKDIFNANLKNIVKYAQKNEQLNKPQTRRTLKRVFRKAGSRSGTN